jgi:hypothetical protein
MRIRKAAITIDWTKPPRPPSNVSAAEVVSAMRSSVEKQSRKTIAAGRILCGGAALWPGAPTEVAFLNLWPSRRRLVGLRLQHALASGATRNEIECIAAVEISESPVKNLAVRIPREAASTLDADFLRDLERDLSIYWSTSWAHCSSPNWAADWAWAWDKYWEQELKDWLLEGPRAKSYYAVQRAVDRWTEGTAFLRTNGRN